MTSAPESFAITLGRASARALRLLSGLKSSDRDDILATAILWCWENRESYNPGVSVETWIYGAVRDAYKAWRRGEARDVQQLNEEIPVPDDTLAAVENRSAAAALAKTLTAQEQAIVIARAEGYSRAEIRQRFQLSKRAYEDGVRRLKQLHHLLPDPASLKIMVKQAAVPPTSDDAAPMPKTIDKQLSRMFGETHEYKFDEEEYVPHAREYVPEEDVRGKGVYWCDPTGRNNWLFGCVIEDYEEDGPARRYKISHLIDGTTRWVTAAVISGDET